MTYRYIQSHKGLLSLSATSFLLLRANIIEPTTHLDMTKVHALSWNYMTHFGDGWCFQCNVGRR